MQHSMTENRRLVIDDIRIMEFDCVYARNVNEAIDYLTKTWDEVWFDWDAGSQYNESTFSPVLDWIEEQIIVNNFKPSFRTAVIHTSNPAGRNILNVVLSRHYKVYNVLAEDFCTGYLDIQIGS